MATNTPMGFRKPDGSDFVNVTSDIANNAELADKFARGEIGSIPLTGASGNLNTAALTDIPGWVTGALALKANRRYKVTVSCMVQSSVAGDRIELLVLKDNPAANTIVNDGITPGLPAGDPITLTFTARFTQAADANVIFRVQGRRRAGTGNCTIQGNAAFPAILLIEDMGRA